jgi:hypothetical protein
LVLLMRSLKEISIYTFNIKKKKRQSELVILK